MTSGTDSAGPFAGRGASASDLIAELRTIVGRRHVLTGDRATRRYRTGFRCGAGAAVAIVRPGTLVEQWRAVRACIAARAAIIMQAANTGLTGGSTPDGDGYVRDVVIVSTLRIREVHLLHGGTQVLCFPGATLNQLERILKPLGREPHSVLGSSCIGASVFGGVCNNSGGALVQRGPAFTEMTLYAQIDQSGDLRLINHLGIRLGSDPETILSRLEARDYTDADVERDCGRGHDHGYVEHVRDTKADTPARFNADPRLLHEASGCAGKLVVFAVRLDTFPNESDNHTFYIGSNDPRALSVLRTSILRTFRTLPISVEYLHRDAFDVAARYGKDTFLMVQALGTARLPGFFALKTTVDSFVRRMPWLPARLTDIVMQAVSRLLPNHLPHRLWQYRARFEHHLILRVGADALGDARALLTGLFPSESGDFFECAPDEASRAMLHRFAVAGAAVRYRAIHPDEVEDIVALDVALRRNETEWADSLPQDLEKRVLRKLYYGHFLCHVMHRDYLVRKGEDPVALEQKLLALLDERGAEYPAEHNVGHLYRAKPALADFYRSLDPTNALNPGIGHTSKLADWKPSA
jgi:D-lactate dehydrogenase